VSRLLCQRGLSLRQAEAATGLSYGVIALMKKGHTPKFHAMAQFIAGLDLEPSEWLSLAGYEPPPPTSGVEVLRRGLQEMARRGRAPAADLDWSRLPAELSIREAYLLLADLEEPPNQEELSPP